MSMPRLTVAIRPSSRWVMRDERGAGVNCHFVFCKCARLYDYETADLLVLHPFP